MAPYVIDDQNNNHSVRGNANTTLFEGASQPRARERPASGAPSLGVATLHELFAAYKQALGESVAPLEELAAHAPHFSALLDEDLERCASVGSTVGSVDVAPTGGAAATSASAGPAERRATAHAAEPRRADVQRCDALFEIALRAVGIPGEYCRALFDVGAQVAAAPTPGTRSGALRSGARATGAAALRLAHRVLRYLHTRGVTLTDIFASRGGQGRAGAQRIPSFVHRSAFLRSLAAAGVQMSAAESELLLGLLEQRADGSVNWSAFESRYGAGDLHLAASSGARALGGALGGTLGGALGGGGPALQHGGASPPPPLPNLLGSPPFFGDPADREEATDESFAHELAPLPKRLSLSTLVAIVARSAAAIADGAGPSPVTAKRTVGKRAPAPKASNAVRKAAKHVSVPAAKSARVSRPAPAVAEVPRAWK